MNWVNLQLQGSGYTVEDFEQDFDDGVKLCALVEALQQRKIGRVSIEKYLLTDVDLDRCLVACFAI